MDSDQKRAAGLGIGGLTLVLAYMQYRKTKSSTAVTTGKASSNATPTLTNGGQFGTVAPYTPQAITTLQPGESAYNPNTGALSTAPDVTTPTTTTPQGTSAASPAYVVNVAYPATVATKKATKKPATRKVTKPKTKPKTKARVTS